MIIGSSLIPAIVIFEVCIYLFMTRSIDMHNMCRKFGRYFNVRTFHPTLFQPLPLQPLTISTYCIFNLPQFPPKLILAN